MDFVKKERSVYVEKPILEATVQKFVNFSNTIYTTSCNGIQVNISPAYIHDAPSAEGHYTWVYFVVISNFGNTSYKLISRYWEVVNGNGKIEVVDGEGVVGKTPVIEPNSSFEYFSHVKLTTPSGMMVGSYTFLNNIDNTKFAVSTPSFSLESFDSINELPN